jgi:hypothetical protein
MAFFKSPTSSLRTASAIGLVLACVFSIAFVTAARAESMPAQGERLVAERLVKAAYLYKFGNYVGWPEGTFVKPDAPLRIGIIGDDELAEELARLVVGRTSNGRPLAVYRIRPDAHSPKVHILYIGTSVHSSELVRQFKGQPALLVTQAENALAQGSMINFVAVDGKLRFEVAPDAVQMSELALSPRLFPIAHKVAALPR